MSEVEKPKKAGRPGKAARAVERVFPDVMRFKAKANFSAVPWLFRRALWLFQPRAWMVLTYLYLRSGPEGITWLTDKQIGIDIDLGYRKVGPQLRELESMGFIVIREFDGERFVCLIDPHFALRALVRAGKITGERLDRLNEDCATIDIEPIDDRDIPPPVAVGTAPLAEGNPM